MYGLYGQWWGQKAREQDHTCILFWHNAPHHRLGLCCHGFEEQSSLRSHEELSITLIFQLTDPQKFQMKSRIIYLLHAGHDCPSLCHAITWKVNDSCERQNLKHNITHANGICNANCKLCLICRVKQMAGIACCLIFYLIFVLVYVKC